MAKVTDVCQAKASKSSIDGGSVTFSDRAAITDPLEFRITITDPLEFRIQTIKDCSITVGFELKRWWWEPMC